MGMIMQDKRGRTSSSTISVASGMAIALLVLSGIGYRTLAAGYADLSGGTPLPSGTLKQLPLQIGDWAGLEVPLDERIVQATDTDDLVNRRYVRSNGKDAVFLFIACGLRMRDLAPHRPEVCYPGAGWTVDDRRVVDVALDDGSKLPVQIHQFSRGGLDSSRISVLNYYLIDGLYCPDVSLLRSKAWRPQNDVRYLAQVQVVSAADTSLGLATADKKVRAFAADSASEIRDLLEAAVAQVTSKNPNQDN